MEIVDETVTAVERLTVRYGYPPTVRELAAELDVNVSSAYQRLGVARDRGLVTWREGSPRTLRVVDRDGRCPLCGQETRDSGTPPDRSDT